MVTAKYSIETMRIMQCSSLFILHDKPRLHLMRKTQINLLISLDEDAQDTIKLGIRAFIHGHFHLHFF